ncbi:DUF6323 family protein [Kroppenstedtia eburnea]|uniref:DUF6323 family protein n=1 Tax=Kroppenstedtia eburnea TaxID=714067 RepID=UPI00363ED577
MFLSQMFNSVNLSIQEKMVDELLESNQKIQGSGLILTRAEIKHMIAVRNKALQDYGRVELGFDVTKELMEVFCSSPYIHGENYASTLNELHELFYHLRNETEDRVGDLKLIHLMKEYFDGDCGGSLELLKSELEDFTRNFRRDGLDDEIPEGDDPYWKLKT